MKSQYKEYYDKKAGQELYEVGNYCWIYSPATSQKLGPGKKLINAWIGPYQVMKVSGVNVQLKRCSDDLPVQHHVHINRIKPFVSREVRPAPPPLEIKGLMEQGPDLLPHEVEPQDIVTVEPTLDAPPRHETDELGEETIEGVQLELPGKTDFEHED